VQGSNEQATADDVVEAEKYIEPDAPQPKPRRARGRGPVVSRFKGFDDDDDVPVSSHPAPDESQVDSAGNGERSQKASVSYRDFLLKNKLTIVEWGVS